MERPACTNCGENVSPEWIVCPVCTHPTKKTADGLSCLQCNGSISANQIICPHCHVPIIRRYCARCERLIPDHAEFCPLCGASREQKRSLRRILRVTASVLAAGAIVAVLLLYLPANSPDKVPVQEQRSSLMPLPLPKSQLSGEAAEIQRIEPRLTMAALPFPSEDLAPATNHVERTTIPVVEPIALNSGDLLQRGARLKAGRKLSELGSLYIRKRRFKEAAMVLREAVKAFPPETRDVTYGESLYHLGYSLRMSGNPAEAIPVLKLALSFPLYSSKVERELKSASAEMKKSR